MRGCSQYPFHWHLNGRVHGQFLSHSSIHHTAQRCVVVHGAVGVRVSDNTCFDVRGHGIFLQDGNEMRTRIERNLVVLARKATTATALLQSEVEDVDIFRFPGPAGIWVAHPTNDVVSNVVVASEGTGLWFSFVRFTCCVTGVGCWVDASDGDACRRAHGEDAYVVEARQAVHGPCDGNVAMSNVVGMNWDGASSPISRNNPLNPFDYVIDIVHFSPPIVPVFRDNAMIKNSNRASYLRGEQVVYERQVFSDNAGATLNAYNQVLRDCLVVGWSANAEVAFFSDDAVRQGIRSLVLSHGSTVGLTLYDGPTVFDGVHFAGFPHRNRPLNGNVEGSCEPACPPVPLATEGASERFVNTCLNVSFEEGRPRRLYSLHPGSSTGAGAERQAVALYDFSGVITAGGAPRTLVYDTPINGHPSCERRDSGSGGLECDEEAYRVGVLQQWGYAPQSHLVRIHGARRPNASDLVHHTSGRRPMQMLLGAGFRYHYVYLDRTPGPPGWEFLNNYYAWHADTLGALSPPIYLWWQEGQCPAGVGVRLTGEAASSFETLESEEAMDAEAAAGAPSVFYSDEERFVLLRVSANRLRQSPLLGELSYFGEWPHHVRARFQSEAFSLGCSDGSQLAPSTRPLQADGQIDGIGELSAEGAVAIWGWACARGVTSPATVRVLAYDAAGEVVTVGEALADHSAEDAVAARCDTPAGSAHRFSFELTLPPSQSWSQFSMLAFRTLLDDAHLYPTLSRNRPVPGAAADDADEPVSFSEYLASVRANPLSGYSQPMGVSPLPPSSPQLSPPASPPPCGCWAHPPCFDSDTGSDAWTDETSLCYLMLFPDLEAAYCTDGACDLTLARCHYELHGSGEGRDVSSCLQ